jgi:SAM-dependent methyltransferase
VSEKFLYKENDLEGMETLEVISEAENLNRWMYETISKYLSGKILEVGSGIGNISEYFLENGADIYVSDIRKGYCDSLNSKFSKFGNYNEAFLIDIAEEDFENKYATYLGFFDSVFALNVVEHIENHDLAIRNCKKLLKPGGVLLILVPAYQALYNKFDKELYHFRRYNHVNLRKLIAGNGLDVQKTFYFNTAGILGWYVSGNILRNKLIPSGQMSFYNKMVPVFKLVDKLVFNKIGLSVVCVAKN